MSLGTGFAHFPGNIVVVVLANHYTIVFVSTSDFPCHNLRFFRFSLGLYYGLFLLLTGTNRHLQHSTAQFAHYTASLPHAQNAAMECSASQFSHGDAARAVCCTLMNTGWVATPPSRAPGGGMNNEFCRPVHDFLQHRAQAPSFGMADRRDGSR